MGAKRVGRRGGRSGVRFLLVTCCGARERQFRGIEAAARLLEGRPGFLHLPWQEAGADAGLLRLRRRRGLRWILLSGHGSPDTARIGDGRTLFIAPADLRLPAGAELYLAACYQGRPELRAAWSSGCRLPPEQVHGAPAETDSFLSACLLLHLAEEGPESLRERFADWQRANRCLEPYFPALRTLYRRCGGDARQLLAEAEGFCDLGPIREFLGVIRRHPDLLSGLAGPESATAGEEAAHRRSFRLARY